MCNPVFNGYVGFHLRFRQFQVLFHIEQNRPAGSDFAVFKQFRHKYRLFQIRLFAKFRNRQIKHNLILQSAQRNRLAFLRNYIAFKIHQTIANINVNRLVFVVERKNADFLFGILDGYGDRCVKVARTILQRFIIAVIIHTRPTANRPAVVKLPIH